MLTRYKVAFTIAIIMLIVSVPIIFDHTSKRQTSTTNESGILDTTNIRNRILEKDYWKLIEEHPAEFPSLIHDLDLSGCLFLTFVIDAQGRATNVETIVNHGSDIAKEAFINSISSWRWLKVTSTAVPIKTSRIFSYGSDTVITQKCYL